SGCVELSDWQYALAFGMPDPVQADPGQSSLGLAWFSWSGGVARSRKISSMHVLFIHAPFTGFSSDLPHVHLLFPGDSHLAAILIGSAIEPRYFCVEFEHGRRTKT
ncbi:MAG TPA: hypothetical protein VMU62_00480, partial [Acidobacteriaceae bacterium]|nr:hypothetical protein [Acidobacteriaceae bacterium]